MRVSVFSLRPATCSRQTAESGEDIGIPWYANASIYILPLFTFPVPQSIVLGALLDLLDFLSIVS